MIPSRENPATDAQPMAEIALSPDGRYAVLVIEMFDHGAESETILRGFPTAELACEYARRRTRDSLEELRDASQSVGDLRRRWLSFGEDCCVIGEHYCAASEVDFFVTHPATAEERDWRSIEALVAR
jgi:hypothetical protein